MPAREELRTLTEAALLFLLGVKRGLLRLDDMVAGDVRRLLGSSSGDLTLRTTLNLELQRLADGVIERRFESEGERPYSGGATKRACELCSNDADRILLRPYE